MRQIAKKSIIIILAFLMVISFNINMNMNLDLLTSMSGNSEIIIFEFIICVFAIKKVLEIKDKRLIICSVCLASVFSLFNILGTSTDMYNNLEGIFFSKTTMIKSIIKFLGNGILFFTVITWLFDYIGKIEINKKIKTLTNKKVGIISFIVILVCYLPYYLTYFPGLTTGDSMNQIFQSIQLIPLTGHHPIVHTGIISLFIHIGNYFGDYNTGIALYTGFQMLIMALIFSYSISYMNKIGLSKIVIIGSLIFYAIYPINPLFSLMMWKDILFAGLMLWFIINTHKVINEDEITIKKSIGYIFNIILLIFFRNNGLYVIILMLPFLYLVGRKKARKLLLIFGIALVLYFIINKIIFMAFNVEKGEIREALSIPMQQFARVEKTYGDELSEDEKAQIYKFIPNENIGEIYMPTLSDPVKNYFDSKAFSNNKIEFVKLWGSLLIKYPRACIESFLCNSYGYYYPQAVNWVANRDVEPNELGIQQHSLSKGKVVRKIDSLIEKRSLPIISMMFSIGFIFWIILFAGTYTIYKKEYKNLLLYIPIILLWLTTLASPVFCEFRYVYSFITCLPFITTIILKKNEK